MLFYRYSPADAAVFNADVGEVARIAEITSVHKNWPRQCFLYHVKIGRPERLPFGADSEAISALERFFPATHVGHIVYLAIYAFTHLYGLRVESA